jgi:hypothetical protein
MGFSAKQMQALWRAPHSARQGIVGADAPEIGGDDPAAAIARCCRDLHRDLIVINRILALDLLQPLTTISDYWTLFTQVALLA